MPVTVGEVQSAVRMHNMRTYCRHWESHLTQSLVYAEAPRDGRMYLPCLFLYLDLSFLSQSQS